eukprot:3221590-Prorocentrum_lima.AAC.1
MTSSLVGSEMCIRDRVIPLEVPETVLTSGLENRPHGSAAGHPVLIYVAVSYTHLTLPTICSV